MATSRTQRNARSRRWIKRLLILTFAGASALIVLSYSRALEVERVTIEDRQWHCITLNCGSLTWVILEDSNPELSKKMRVPSFVTGLREIWLSYSRDLRARQRFQFYWRKPASQSLSKSCRMSLIAGPVWPIPILFAAILAFIALKRRKARRARPQLACRACWYDLRGNTSGRCPECGSSISPELQETINATGSSNQVSTAAASHQIEL